MSLRTKIFLRVAILLSLLIIVICISTSIFLIKGNRKLAKEHFSSETEFIAEQSERLIIWDDRLALKTLITQQTQSHSTISYIFIKRAGQAYIHTFPEAAPRALLALPDSDSKKTTLATIQDTQGEILYDISTRIGQSDAILHIGLSRNNIDRQLTGHLFIIATLGALIVVIGLFLSFGIAIITVREVDKMTDAIKKKTISIDILNDANQQLQASQQKLMASNQELESEVAERKKAERGLESTMDKLSQSNRQLQELVYVASHDLKEPVRKISSFGQLLNDSLAGKLDEDDQENFGFMIDGANRMQQMIESLLVFSRVITKGVEFQEVDLNETVEYIKGFELAVKLEESGGGVVIPQPLPIIKGDPAQIAQLMQHLIGNALKYCRKDIRPQVTIRAYKQDDGMVRIEVEDNGIGIRANLCDNVFVMFRRMHSRQEYEGTGIGLAVCKRIVERHGGQIGVTSTYGEGSTFWFTVPKLQEQPESQEEIVSTVET